MVLAQGGPDLNEQKAQAQALEKRLPVPTLKSRTNFDLSPARQERLQKYLPSTYRKLTQRETVNLLVLGDASAFQIQEAKITETFPGVFSNLLANQFFYTGGVKETVGPASTEVPTIQLRTLARADGSVLDAAAILESTARQAPVDVVLICYGQADVGMQPPTFSSAIAAAISAAREIGAEVMLCSPWLPVAEKSEGVLGLTRPLADVTQETATELNVLHVDLGDLSNLLSVPSSQTEDEAQIFERIESTYREFFYLNASGSYIPRPSLHQQLGSLLYQELLDAPSGRLWTIQGARASQTEADKLTLTYTLKNPGKKAQKLTALPLIANGWKPVEARTSLTLEPGVSQSLSVSYVTEGTPLPVKEPILRLPVLICSGSVARVETLRATVQPVTVVWSLETLFNQESGFLVGCQLVNPDKATVKGTWTAEFAGQKLNGSFDLKTQAVLPLNLQFDLPKDASTAGPRELKLTVETNGKSLTYTRPIILTPNLGLGQNVPLVAASGVKSPAPITLTPKANASTLTLTFNLPSTDLIQDSAGGGSPAWQIEVNLDARSYGKRLEEGSTATLRATGQALDGPGKVHPIPAWAFGNGYAATFDPKEFKAALISTDDTRQVTLTLPRTYLYLHEWALDNGNSQLGLGVRLTLMGADGYVTYLLSPTLKPRDDIESLVVLELTEKPTPRVTVDVE